MVIALCQAEHERIRQSIQVDHYKDPWFLDTNILMGFREQLTVLHRFEPTDANTLPATGYTVY